MEGRMIDAGKFAEFTRVCKACNCKFEFDIRDTSAVSAIRCPQCNIENRESRWTPKDSIAKLEERLRTADSKRAAGVLGWLNGMFGF